MRPSLRINEKLCEISNEAVGLWEPISNERLCKQRSFDLSISVNILHRTKTLTLALNAHAPATALSAPDMKIVLFSTPTFLFRAKSQTHPAPRTKRIQTFNQSGAKKIEASAQSTDYLTTAEILKTISPTDIFGTSPINKARGTPSIFTDSKTNAEALLNFQASFNIEQNFESKKRVYSSSPINLFSDPPGPNSKMFRSFPERYNMKISSIEETADVATMRIGDLISKLVTFEMNLEQQKVGHVTKSVAFRAENPFAISDVANMSEFTDVVPEDEDDANIAMLVKNFNNMLKSFKKEKFKSGNRTTSRMSVGSSSNINSVKKNFGSTSEVLLVATVDEEESSDDEMIGALQDLDDVSEVILSDEDVEFETMSVDGNVDMSVDDNVVNIDSDMSVEKVDSETLDVSDTLEEHEFDSLKDMGNFKNLFKIADTQCQELRNDLCMLVDENQKLRSQITRLERLLSQRDVEVGKLKGFYSEGSSKMQEHHNTTVFVKEDNVSKNVDNIKDSQKKKSKKKRFEFRIMLNGKKKNETCNVVVYSSLHVASQKIGMTVKFDKHLCEVFDDSNCRVMMGKRSSDNCYKSQEDNIYNVAKLDDVELWHQRLGHVNFKNLQRLIAHIVVRGLPNTFRCFELLHMNLMGPIEVESLGGKMYVLVCADDFSRIRTDHSNEFENSLFDDLCTNYGIFHEFSVPKTPQRNGVAERKNMTIQEMVRAMLHAKSLSKRLWAEAVNTTCHIINRVYMRPDTMLTYEILKGKKPNLKYFHIFWCVCYILNDRDQLSKFNSKSDKDLFLGYFVNSHAYRMYNLRTKTIQETVNVVFDDALSLVDRTDEEDVTKLLEEFNVNEQASDHQTNDNVGETSNPTSGVTSTESTSEKETGDYVSDSEDE
ncbi:uncharacterized protein LOC131023282 [Salvia miltiorrhiza]|uniref:uncharacterized protein LOC131023282 n=1 Tax=Salvia miltiorrhiza TaxID=226208 RepID=UPI0025AD51FF|nr:uncharacterized protein LOC131023282 [Salvia miltiorrhiza]